MLRPTFMGVVFFWLSGLICSLKHGTAQPIGLRQARRPASHGAHLYLSCLVNCYNCTCRAAARFCSALTASTVEKISIRVCLHLDPITASRRSAMGIGRGDRKLGYRNYGVRV